MADENKTPATAKDIEGATPEAQPANVVTDNTGVVPVQPVGTSDPTIDDNTNPKVPFDGADPRNIPPADSNEQLHIAAEKRMGGEMSSLANAADKRRKAVEAAYDNSQDVRDVVGDVEAQTGGSARVDSEKLRADASHPSAARSTPPQGRTSKPTSKS
jgi:hypothetical protein